MSDFAERLRSSGKRLTTQRELILRAVDRLGHGTPDEILAEVRQHSQAVNASTIYRNLEVLEELGLVRHAHLSDRAPTWHSVRGRDHFHLVCRNCERVSAVDAERAAGFVSTLRTELNFQPDIGHLTVFGTCVDCAESPEPPETPEHHHEEH